MPYENLEDFSDEDCERFLVAIQSKDAERQIQAACTLLHLSRMEYLRAKHSSEGHKVIKKAYNNAALKYHPDRNPDAQEKAEIVFDLVTKARDALNDAVALKQEQVATSNRRRQSSSNVQLDKDVRMVQLSARRQYIRSNPMLCLQILADYGDDERSRDAELWAAMQTVYDSEPSYNTHRSDRPMGSIALDIAVTTRYTDMETALHPACACQDEWVILKLLDSLNDDVLNQALALRTHDGWTALDILKYRAKIDNNCDGIKIIWAMLQRISIDTLNVMFSLPSSDDSFEQAFSLKSSHESLSLNRDAFINNIECVLNKMPSEENPISMSNNTDPYKNVLEKLLSCVTLMRNKWRIEFFGGADFNGRLDQLIIRINDLLPIIQIVESDNCISDISQIDIMSDQFFSQSEEEEEKDEEDEEEKKEEDTTLSKRGMFSMLSRFSSDNKNQSNTKERKLSHRP